VATATLFVVRRLYAPPETPCQASSGLTLPTVVRTTAERLYDDNPHPRWRSLWALSAIDSEETFPPLRTALEDPDQVVVRNAAVALAFFGQP